MSVFDWFVEPWAWLVGEFGRSGAVVLFGLLAVFAVLSALLVAFGDDR